MREPAPERPPTLLSLLTYVAGQVSKRARGDVQAALGDRGLGTSEYGVLAALADFGALSQQQLADRLDADKSHIVRLIDQLEQRDLVARAPDPTDRRRHRIDLTGPGRTLIAELIPAVDAADAAHLEGLSAAERRTLATLLRRVLESQDRARWADRAP